MRRLGILALGAALALGCGPTRRAWVPRRVAPVDAPTAYAVVSAHTPLHVAPDRRAATVRLPAEGFVPMRILRERDGWVYLETLGEVGDRHCAEGLPRLEPFRLRLFAPVTALVRVTSREVSQRFRDETSIELSRGVPLQQVQDHLWRAHLGSATAIVQIPVTDTGTRYLPSPALERGETGRTLTEDALRASVPVFGQTGRLSGDEALPVHARHERGGEVVVEVRPRCARLRVRAPTHTVTGAVLQAPPVGLPVEAPVGLPLEAAVESPEEDGVGSAEAPVEAPVEPPVQTPVEPSASTPVEAAPVEPRFAAPGSAVFWANEQPAGVVVSPAPLGDEIAVPTDRRCFRQPLDEAGEAGGTVVILCFRARDVVEPGAGAARRLDAPG